MDSQHREWSALYQAAEAGDEAMLDELVSQGADLNMQAEAHGPAVLHALSMDGITHGAELLIRKGANIEISRGMAGRTALHIATMQGHANLVQKLLELGANVHARESQRPHGSFRMPLHLVALLGSNNPSYIQILRDLLKHGGAFDLLVGDADGNTPLHCAMLNRCTPHAIIKELLSILSTSSSSSADDLKPAISSVVNMQNHKGRTPLHYAMCINARNFEVARLLLDAGARVDACDVEGAMPFHHAACNGNPEGAHLLLEAGASKNACDAYGASPFHYAARSGNVCILDMLNVEDVDAPAIKNNFRALHYAAWNQHQGAVEWLLEHGASVNVTDTYKGDTPLHLAARRGDAQVIRILITRGSADFLLTNKKGELALGLADDGGYHEAAKAFVEAVREQNRQDRLHDVLWTKHTSNGASLLHYFAAYGTGQDMEWILKAMKHEISPFKYTHDIGVTVDGGAVNACDNVNRNAVHWAAMKDNAQTLRILAQNSANLNADMNKHGKGHFPKTPLYLALLNGKKAFANEIMQVKSEFAALHAQNWLSDINRWMMDYYIQESKLKDKLARLRDGFEKHKYPRNIPNDTLFCEIPSIYLALLAEREDIATFIQQHCEGADDAVNERGKQSGRTSLHWAVLFGQRKIVAQLCRKLFKDDLTATVEDKCRKTALQYAKEIGAKDTESDVEKDIEKELMQRSDVAAHIDGLYKDRQVYVDAANAILVGAALIAGVTFAGWLQPPLGYINYYNLPQLSAPAKADAFYAYAAVQQAAGVRWFWVFNSLSFSFAIATVLAGLVAVAPIPGIYIVKSVAHLHQCLLIASVLLGSSIVFVLIAFAAAGFAVLPPFFKYKSIMLETTIVGAIPCALLLTWFCGRLVSLCPQRFMAMPMARFVSAVNACRLCRQDKTETKGASSSKPYAVLDDIPAKIVVDSSTPFHASTHKESTDGKESIPPSEDASSCKDPAPQDEDYRVGEDYDEAPWNDGLNVSVRRVSRVLTFS